MNELSLNLNQKKDYYIDISETDFIDQQNRDYFILIRKETGSWCVIDKIHQELLNTLYCTCTFDEFNNSFPNKIEVLKTLFQSDVLRINGNYLMKSDWMTKLRKCVDYPAALIVKYTRDCNLHCSYCYAATNEKRSLSMDNSMVIQLLKKMIDTYGDRKFALTLHGGEPTIRYYDIVELVTEIKKISSKIEVTLQTNATLITNEVAEFFAKENIRVGISLDGYDDYTNSCRLYRNGASSLEKSLKGLENLVNARATVGLLCVITSINQDYLLDYISFYQHKGIKYFVFNTFCPAGRGENKKYEVDNNNFVDTYIKLILYINNYNASQNDRKHFIAERGISSLIKKITTREDKYMCTQSPCGAGRGTLGFDMNGAIYPCDSFISHEEFEIGNIFECNDLRKIIVEHNATQSLLNHNIITIKECSLCPWKMLCTTHCASNAFFFNKDFNHPGNMCKSMKLIIPQIIDLLKNNLINPSNFIFD